MPRDVPTYWNPLSNIVQPSTPWWMTRIMTYRGLSLTGMSGRWSDSCEIFWRWVSILRSAESSGHDTVEHPTHAVDFQGRVPLPIRNPSNLLQETQGLAGEGTGWIPNTQELPMQQPTSGFLCIITAVLTVIIQRLGRRQSPSRARINRSSPFFHLLLQLSFPQTSVTKAESQSHSFRLWGCVSSMTWNRNSLLMLFEFNTFYTITSNTSSISSILHLLDLMDGKERHIRICFHLMIRAQVAWMAGFQAHSGFGICVTVLLKRSMLSSINMWQCSVVPYMWLTTVTRYVGILTFSANIL